MTEEEREQWRWIVQGVTEQQAIRKLREGGVEHRVTSRDNQHYACTCDLHPDRLNLTVLGGVVARIHFG